jgi:hypothetical protein
VRDLQATFFHVTTSAAPTYLERYSAAADNPEFEELPEEAQLLVGDKDALLNALQVGGRVCGCGCVGVGGGGWVSKGAGVCARLGSSCWFKEGQPRVLQVVVGGRG